MDESVVAPNAGGRGVGLCRGEEQQPELVAGAEPGGNQPPVVGYRDFRWRRPRHHDGIGLGVQSVLGLYYDFDYCGIAHLERDLMAVGVGVRVRERRARGVLIRDRRIDVRRLRLDGDLVHAAGHRCLVLVIIGGESRVQWDGVAVTVLQRQAAQRRVGRGKHLEDLREPAAGVCQLDEGRTVPGGVKPCISAPKIRPNGGETPCQGRL